MKTTYNVQDLMRMFNSYSSYKERVLPEWRLMRSLYRGDFWKEFSKNLKTYTMTPDCNYIEYNVQAYENSVYSGAFIGTLTPVHMQDEKLIDKLNAFVQYNWNKWGMKNKFLQIGENGELYNIGAIRVDWDDEHKQIILDDVLPTELYFDPSCVDYRKGHALFIERSTDIDVLGQRPMFKDAIKDFLAVHTGHIIDKTLSRNIDKFELNQDFDSRNVSLIEAFIRNKDGKLDQVFILNEDTIIYENLNLDICEFPVVVYSPQRPDTNPYGRSKLHKIVNTAITLNLLDSLEATQPYRLLNRVKFINADSKVNMRAFSEYGNVPGASFQVKGDPRSLVYYQDIPILPDLSIIKNRLEQSIFNVTGVDAYYKGRATNSVQTTGATQAMQARVTMLTDNSRLIMLEEFCERLTRIIIDYYRNYGLDTIYHIPKKAYARNNKIVDIQELNFNDLRGKKFDYMLNASVLLPMNQANLFESAKALYEMQGQYQFKRQVISEEDLVRYSDFPQKDLILQRLERDSQNDTTENLVADLTNFASIFSKLLSKGLDENTAAQQAIQILVEEKNQMQQDPSLGMGMQ